MDSAGDVLNVGRKLAMNDFKVGDEVWMFGFVDGQMIGFNPEQIAIDSAILNQSYESIIDGVKLFKSKNEAIDAMIKRLEELREE